MDLHQAPIGRDARVGIPFALTLGEGEGRVANRVAIFVDGAYVEKAMRSEFGGVRIDFNLLSERLAGDAEILRTYYYHCALYQDKPPTPEQSKRYTAQRAFFRALEAYPRYTLRLGRLAKRDGDDGGTPRFVQKQVDIMLGVDLTLLAAKRIIQEAVVVAGDSDFIPAVTAAKAEGVVVRVAQVGGRHSELWREADERTLIDREFVDSIRLEQSRSR